MNIVFPVVDTLSLLTLAGDIIIVVLFFTLILEHVRKSPTQLTQLISTHAILLMLIVAVIATAGSLFLSEIAGWAPCRDCWFQRIFMYPQVVLLGVALWKRDRDIALYVFLLCAIGAVLSTHHYAEQIHATLWPEPLDPLVPCDDTGVSCAKTYTLRFGYITIPMMALTAFLLNAIGSAVMLRDSKKRK